MSTAPVSDAPAAPISPPPVSLNAELRPLRAAVYTALALSVAGFVLAITVPVWSPRVYGNTTSAHVLALGVAQLRPALESEKPFSAELTTLRRIASDDKEVSQALAAIASESNTGVPTLPQLQTRFLGVASQILLSDVVEGSRSWFDRALVDVATALNLHVQLQRTRDKLTPSQEIIVDAQAALGGGDLVGAVHAMEKLSGHPAEIAAPWIRAARARIAANRVLRLLDSVAEIRLSSRPLVVATTR